MRKRIISLAMAAFMIVATAVPAFAAGSPDTGKVNTNPVTVPSNVTASKGYTLTPEEEATVATTPEQAAQFAAGVVAQTNDGQLIVETAAEPAMVSMAKADILKDEKVKKSLASKGVTGTIVNAGMLYRTDNKTKKTTVNLSSANLVQGEKVAVLYYVPGDLKPHIVSAVWVKGKLRVTLPLPCTYSIIK